MTKHARAAFGSMNNFDLILKTLEAGADLSPTLKTWLITSILKVKWGLPLDRAFGVSTDNKKAKRNELLKHYAQSLNAPSDWEKARLILTQLNRMESGRKCSPMIADANDFHKIPKSHRQLFRIIRETDKNRCGNVNP